ncbi:FumA C-terminus/TtdB family hydratase beta subunit [Methanolobus sediminis]|uniref:FumA C-terminus/TtdB family hydratase beta subunit n=1 Tax=Methanolobus sediminis TaxID=3072978 RepID=A0AA51YM62_9EURY|nr:FumA C-terminus/TtdB family hydratase beta subunit [Methanolobus sediminis]WMW25679.1 FumA C-terminus/TtdB family hydratase beta subunit [Methanolobus sediminis]
MEYRLNTPLKKEDVDKLKAGDIVYLSGTVYTARDEAHARILEMAEEKKELPFDLEGAVIYHCGPLMKGKDDDWEVVAAGPTTSARMSKMTPKLLDIHGVRAFVGKGGMDNVTGAMKGKSVYLAFTGGCAALAAMSIEKVNTVHWLDLGMPEAVWELKVKNFGPLVVGIDSHENDLFTDVRKKALEAYSKIE